MSCQRTDLVPIQGMWTRELFVQQILTPVVCSLAQQFRPRFIFQQNNAYLHTSRVAIEALNGISILNWPACMDMSAIKHLWYELGRRVCDQYEDSPATVVQLQQRLVEQFGKIEMPTIRHLPLGMSKRIAEIVKRKSAHTLLNAILIWHKSY